MIIQLHRWVCLALTGVIAWASCEMAGTSAVQRALRTAPSLFSSEALAPSSAAAHRVIAAYHPSDGSLYLALARREGYQPGLAADAASFISRIERLFTGTELFPGELSFYLQLNKTVDPLEDAALSPAQRKIWKELIQVFDERFRTFRVGKGGKGGTFPTSFRLFEGPELSTVAMIRFEDRTVFYINRAFLSHLEKIAERLKQDGFQVGIPADILGLDSAFGPVNVVRSVLENVADIEIRGHHMDNDRFDMISTDPADLEKEIQLQAMHGDDPAASLRAAAYGAYLEMAGINTDNFDAGLRLRAAGFAQEVRRIQAALLPHVANLTTAWAHAVVNQVRAADPGLRQRLGSWLTPAGRAQIEQLLSCLRAYYWATTGTSRVLIPSPVAVELLWFAMRRMPDLPELREFERLVWGERQPDLDLDLVRQFIDAVNQHVYIFSGYAGEWVRGFMQMADSNPTLRELLKSSAPEDHRLLARYFTLATFIEHKFSVNRPGHQIPPWMPALYQDLTSGVYPWDELPERRRTMQPVFEHLIMREDDTGKMALKLNEKKFDLVQMEWQILVCISARVRYYQALEKREDPASISVFDSLMREPVKYALKATKAETFGALAQRGVDIHLSGLAFNYRIELWAYLTGLGLLEAPRSPKLVQRTGPRPNSPNLPILPFARREGVIRQAS